MKAVMYHYVRERVEGLPNFRFLHFRDFCKQLDLFEQHFRFISLNEFVEIMSGDGELPDDVVVLTFDDGLQDHYRYVFPELVKRNTFGIFYSATQPLAIGKFLDVHRIHLLVGSVSGQELLDQLNAVVSQDMIPDSKVAEFQKLTYLKQDNSQAVTTIKRILNYFIGYQWRTGIIDILIKANNISSVVDEFYLTDQQLREMHRNGMLIGSHSVSHPVLSRLPYNSQLHEIQESFKFLDEVVGGLTVKTFCYPYGGFHSFNRMTEDILSQENCLFSFNVESRDIYRRDIVERPQALPRFDCNEFPHGIAS